MKNNLNSIEKRNKTFILFLFSKKIYKNITFYNFVYEKNFQIYIFQNKFTNIFIK